MKNDEGKSINGSEFKIKVLNTTAFTLEECDYRDYTPYEGNGTAKQLKVPVKLQFQTLEEVEAAAEPKIDSNLAIYDFEKMDNHKWAHAFYTMYPKFMDQIDQGTLTIDYDKYEEEFWTFLSKSNLIPSDLTPEQTAKVKKLSEAFTTYYWMSMPPMCAFLGGVVA